MPEVNIEIGGRKFTVACGDGEELHLKSAASLLDAEAQKVLATGNLPENRLLLMAGLMLADGLSATAEADRAQEEKVEAMEARMRDAEDRAAAARRDLESAEAEVARLQAALEAQPETPPAAAPDNAALKDIIGELEALADSLEAEKADA